MDNFAANLKEVNDLIDADIEYAKEKVDMDVVGIYGSPLSCLTVICDICNHEIHPHCNNANCEDGNCWKDGMDFEDDDE